jgi:uncharacterized membrane protein YqiK
MRRYYPRTYRSRRPLKIILTSLVALLIAVVILTVSLFFGLRRYIVYDNNGTLHLDIPWLSDVLPDNQKP